MPAQRLPAHVVFDGRVAARDGVLDAEAHPDARGRVPVLLRTRLIVGEDVIDDPGEGVQCPTPDRFRPTIPGRQAVVAASCAPSPGQPESPGSCPLAHSLHRDDSAHRRIALHSIDPSGVPHEHRRQARWTTRAVWFSAARRQFHTAALWSIRAPPFSNGRAHLAKWSRPHSPIRYHNPTEAAYARSNLFERRQRLMDEWAAYLSGAHGQVSHDNGNRASRLGVLPIPATHVPLTI